MEYEDLPETRLGTTDEKGRRIYVHPHDLKGKWKNRRKVIYWFLIAIYLILPWIYIQGKQIVLLDLPKREFFILGKTFYGHDGPLLVFLLLGFLFFISFVTSIWGRVWCGYACPQTVFIDAIYRFIERSIEGTGPKREKLDKAPMSVKKLSLRITKWFLYIVASLHIVHSGLGYFVGTRNLLNITLQDPSANLSLFITMLSLTLIILIDFGWFREQFCIIACPYGRFQSLVMDENSLVVAYDKERGEPRKRTKDIAPSDNGDCVSCNRCVHVCPTGIDIRDGLQMECIACTMCIDACDEIMVKVNKPKGLIKYSSEVEMDGKDKKVSFRSYIYGILFLIVLVGLFFNLSVRDHLKAQLIRGSHSTYQIISKSDTDKVKIVNHFVLKMNYYSSTKLDLNFVTLEQNSNIEIIIPEEPVNIQNENKEINIFFQFYKEELNHGERKIKLLIKSNNEIIKVMEVELVGPVK